MIYIQRYGGTIWANLEVIVAIQNRIAVADPRTIAAMTATAYGGYLFYSLSFISSSVEITTEVAAFSEDYFNKEKQA